MRYTSKRGKRGGRSGSFSGEMRKDIHSRIDGLPAAHHAGHSHNVDKCKSTTAVVADAAKYFECAFIDETAETHVIPRQSVTRKQLLGVFPQRIETEPRKTRQIDTKSGELVETTDQRLTWKSDRTLLRRGNPFTDAENGNRTGYKRDGSVSVGLDRRKTRDAIPNADPVMETVIGPALDDVWEFDTDRPLTEEEIAAALDKG